MASIASIVKAGKGTAGHYGSWRCETNSDGYVSLRHYGREMLAWRSSGDLQPDEIVCVSVGWGSVSDQGGVNKALKVLGFDHLVYYSRNGGYAHYAMYSGQVPTPWIVKRWGQWN